jgi:hypothetical protein
MDQGDSSTTLPARGDVEPASAGGEFRVEVERLDTSIDRLWFAEIGCATAEQSAMLVEQLLQRIAEVRACDRGGGEFAAELRALSDIELRALGVWLTLRRQPHDKPTDLITRQALTLLVLLGADTGYAYAAGVERIVILGPQAVWKLSLNHAGDITSETEAGAAIAAPVAPARWRTIAGIRVLEMERVEVVRPDALTDEELRNAPWWTDVDGWQIGRRTTGELVVFDAGEFGPAHRSIMPDRYRVRLDSATIQADR